MRGRLLASLLAAGILLVSTAVAGTSPLQERAYEVRTAIPAAIAYYADHGTWRGMTVNKLRRYDRSIKNVVVTRATKSGFCIQSTKTPFAHFASPSRDVRKGRCGVRGAVIPFVPRTGSPPPPANTAEQRLRAAVPAIEAYAADHNGYAGMTIAALRRYDAGVVDITIVRATRSMYCIESGTGADQFHRNGPAEPNAPGPCPVTG
jgi:hypothetical protein